MQETTNRPEAEYEPIFSFAWGGGDLEVAAGIVPDMLQREAEREPVGRTTRAARAARVTVGWACGLAW